MAVLVFTEEPDGGAVAVNSSGIHYEAVRRDGAGGYWVAYAAGRILRTANGSERTFASRSAAERALHFEAMKGA